MNKKAIFLTHPELLRSAVTGGVQLCSQEFHNILENADGITLEDYYVHYTRNIWQRVLIKAGMEIYSMYDIKKDAPALLQYIHDNNIGIVFINMASLVRYAAPIRKRFGDAVKIVLLSHGNHSCDFLHLMTKPIKKPSLFRSFLNKVRLGMLVAIEAEHRVRYLDGVVAISETEKQIENWFGGKRVVFTPRRLYTDFLAHKPVKGRVGFVGRLDHPPNLQGISILLDEMKNKDHSNLEFRLVGAPVESGNQLQRQYPFVKYLGELPDKALEEEVATWSILLNPVWWYSTGASTKLARAISWGVPIVSTTIGMRGYEWKKGSLIMAETPESMVQMLLEIAPDAEKVRYWTDQTRLIAVNGLTVKELAEKIQLTYQ